MPTYEYVCVSCGTHVEVYQKFSDEPLSECGVCGGRLRKVFHPAGILFKGSGFYATDSRSGRSRASAAKSESGESTSGTSDSGSGGGSEGGTDKAATPKKEGSSSKAPSTKEASA
jgi:putative FmdB family regulatory protein